MGTGSSCRMDVLWSIKLLKIMRNYYPTGTRVELVRMEDPYTKLKPGDKGTVVHVDDIGTIHINWDCGSSLGVAFGVDQCRRIKECANKKDVIIIEQILAIRDSGRTNMLDTIMVQRIAYDQGYYDLVVFMEEHREKYVHFIMTGEFQ